MIAFAPGVRVLIRDEEWLIRRVDPSTDGCWHLTCDSVSGLVRGRDALSKTRNHTPESKTCEGNFCYEDQWAYPEKSAATAERDRSSDQPKVPDGTVIPQWVNEDTLPSGPGAVARRRVAPLARANREDDCRTARAPFPSDLH